MVCDETESQYKAVLYHSGVLWLSRRRALTRVARLRNEISEFLKQRKSEHGTAFTNDEFQLEHVLYHVWLIYSFM